jgi:hypothetical protein
MIELLFLLLSNYNNSFCLLHFSEGCHPGSKNNLNRLKALKRFEQDSIWEKFGAGDGDRTRDVQLGKLAFYR